MLRKNRSSGAFPTLPRWCREKLNDGDGPGQLSLQRSGPACRKLLSDCMPTAMATSLPPSPVKVVQPRQTACSYTAPMDSSTAMPAATQAQASRATATPLAATMQTRKAVSCMRARYFDPASGQFIGRDPQEGEANQRKPNRRCECSTRCCSGPDWYRWIGRNTQRSWLKPDSPEARYWVSLSQTANQRIKGLSVEGCVSSLCRVSSDSIFSSR